MSREEIIDIRNIALDDARELVAKYHGYGAMGKVATYTFGVFEEARIVAAFVWLPPPPGAAMALSAAPGGAGVLALSRMVAVPRNERRMQHISKALYRQASRMIDRGRWPVLVTWSDASLGHTGHVYKCAGWQEDEKRKAVFFEDEHGHRASRYSNGKIVRAGKGASTVLTRWIDRACPEGAELRHLLSNGWVRVPTGKVWASGKPAYTWEKQV